MKPVTLAEIVAIDHYPELRPSYREAIVAHKRARRLAVGEKVTLVFEDHETLRFQIQEMLWIERIVDLEKAQSEIDIYNELMPGDSELSATLFVEITDVQEVRPELDRLVGIDEHVSLVLEGDRDEERIPARFDPKQMEEDRISAVQYIRFPLSDAQVQRFADPQVPARVRIDHPNYRCEAPVAGDLRASLQQTLAGGIEPLLPPEPEQSVAHREAALLAETARVRTLRPAHPQAAGHVVVEARDPDVTLLTADRELLAELFAAVQRAAAELVDRHGSCRIRADVRPDAPGLRWHLLAPGHQAPAS